MMCLLCCRKPIVSGNACKDKSKCCYKCCWTSCLCYENCFKCCTCFHPERGPLMYCYHYCFEEKFALVPIRKPGQKVQPIQNITVVQRELVQNQNMPAPSNRNVRLSNRNVVTNPNPTRSNRNVPPINTNNGQNIPPPPPVTNTQQFIPQNQNLNIPGFIPPQNNLQLHDISPTRVNNQNNIPMHQNQYNQPQYNQPQYNQPMPQYSNQNIPSNIGTGQPIMGTPIQNYTPNMQNINNPEIETIQRQYEVPKNGYPMQYNNSPMTNDHSFDDSRMPIITETKGNRIVMEDAKPISLSNNNYSAQNRIQAPNVVYPNNNGAYPTPVNNESYPMPVVTGNYPTTLGDYGQANVYPQQNLNYPTPPAQGNETLPPPPP